MYPSNNSPPGSNQNNVSSGNSRTTDTRFDVDHIRPVESVRTTPSIVSPKG